MNPLLALSGAGLLAYALMKRRPSPGERVKVGDRFEADLSSWTKKENDIAPTLNVRGQMYKAVAVTVEGVPRVVVGQHEPTGVLLGIPAPLITRIVP